MEGIDRNRISSLEPPAGKGRLHDLEAVRGEGDALEEFALVHAGLRRPSEAECNLRLDARLGKMGDAEPGGQICEVVNGGIVHVSPDRGMDAVLVPDRRVRKADLAANDALASRLPNRRTDAVTPYALSSGSPPGRSREKPDLPAAVGCGEDFGGDRFPGRCLIMIVDAHHSSDAKKSSSTRLIRIVGHHCSCNARVSGVGNFACKTPNSPPPVSRRGSARSIFAIRSRCPLAKAAPAILQILGAATSVPVVARRPRLRNQRNAGFLRSAADLSRHRTAIQDCTPRLANAHRAVCSRSSPGFCLHSGLPRAAP